MAIKVANNQSLTAITSIPASITGGAMTLLETKTASSSATLDFTSDIDDTYDEYVFKFYNIHPATNATQLQVNFRDGSTAYDATKTSTAFNSQHKEDGSGGSLGYETGTDIAQGTGFMDISVGAGYGNDECLDGTLHLYDPSNTTFVKHFISDITFGYNTWLMTTRVSGYCNVTAAIDGVQFKMSSDEIDSGVIKLYGIS